MNQHNCDVCGDPLTSTSLRHKHRSQYQICSSIGCKNTLEHCATMTSHSAALYLKLQRQLNDQRKQFQVDEQQRIARLKEHQKRENDAVVEQTLAANPEIDPQRIQVIEIPSGVKQTAPLKSHRVKEYAAHIRARAKQANQHKNSSEIPDPELHKTFRKRQSVDRYLDEDLKTKAISEALCTMCKGGCCTSGKNTAYISELTIRRHMDANPSQSVEDVVNHYLSYLTDSPMVDSCINQTSKGCGLPRAMRSDICNGYFCDSIKSFHDQDIVNRSQTSILAIQRANTHWKRLAADVDKQIVDRRLFKSGS